VIRSKRYARNSAPVKGSKKDFDPSKIYYREYEAEGIRAKKDWQNFDPKGNVYLIGNKALGYYKIGLTRDCEAPDKRFRTIQNGVPFELDVLRYWFVSHAGSFEKLLHYEFREQLIRGEWFSFPADNLESVLSKIKEWANKVPSLNNQGVAGQNPVVGKND
jgi:hypothetical protein